MIAPPPREPNGRHRRSIARAAELLVAQTASQPHRRGIRSTAGATPWQRALTSGRIRDHQRSFSPGELETAGLWFCEARVNYLRAIGAPNGYAVDGTGRGGDLPPRLRRKWLREWRGIRAALVTDRDGPLLAILAATEAHPDADEREWPTEFKIAVSDALVGLAGHFKIRL